MELRDELKELNGALAANTPRFLGADSPLTEDDWNRVVNSINSLKKAIVELGSLRPHLPPIGFCYRRFPGMAAPWNVYKFTIESDWKAIHNLYPGCFERLDGGNSSRFQEAYYSVMFDEGIKGNGGGQIDCLQGHSHEYEESYSESGCTAAYGGSYTFLYKNETKKTGNPKDARFDGETRPKNITVQSYIYKWDECFTS